MDGIKVAIKHFFRNKNTVTILTIVLCIGILYWAYNFRINSKTRPESVPYALREIGPRTLITEDMVGTIKVAGSMISSGSIRNSQLVVGKYVSDDAVIPKGSLFYSDTLVSWDDLPTSFYSDIPEGNTVVSLPVTMESTYGNSIFPGNYIDLYYAGIDSNGKLLLGKFIESIKVLTVLDSSGNEVFKSGSSLSSPAYLVFSVPEDYHLLLRKASYLSGNIFPVPRNAEYSKNPSETKISSSYLQNYILVQTVNVAEEDLKLLGPSIPSTENNNEGGTQE